MTDVVPGVRCADRFRTRDEVMARARRVARGVGELGIRPGDAVAVVLRNEIENVEITLGIAHAGAVPVSVNWHLKEQELGYLLRDSRAALVFAHTDLLPRVLATGTAAPVVEVPTTPALRRAYGPVESAAARGDHELETWLAAQDDEEPASSVPQLGLLYSSGTTGTPKGILREPATPEQSALLGARILDAFGLEGGTSTLVPAPLYHAAPNAHVLFGLTADCEITLMPRFSAAGFLEAVERHAIVHAQVVPTMLVRLLQLPEQERLAHDVSSLRCVVHAAGPCPPEVKHAVIDWWGPILHGTTGAPRSAPSWRATARSGSRTPARWDARSTGATSGSSGRTGPRHPPGYPERSSSTRARRGRVRGTSAQPPGPGHARGTATSASATGAGSTTTATSTCPTGPPTW
ncbi:AMP-binding protein [Actinomycetospora sp. TBRC 11914]|uniref:AMP-binding protein n=1 Tax=Actinomycetospora sp. TBRC 11914 TaxID=2729387 RepID=UPI00145DB34E|nr:AMP-binding protein [Actinomycetospora sp. TBRC 11914]NMO91588.1 AMP-binding protein [Actinomycetospora sp. TBRC 11914]